MIVLAYYIRDILCKTDTRRMDFMNKQIQRFVGVAMLYVASSSVWAGQMTPVPDVQPVANGWQVVINIPQQRLFLYKDGKLETVYPVTVGKAITQTTIGEHKIGAKAFNPTWHIPLSIQKERNDGVKSVGPGPNNPLGPVFVRLGNPKLGIGIHGTNAPASVPGVRSHGCVRMKSEQALEFANTVPTGSAATVSYEMAALNVDDANNLWLAVYKDPYDKKNLNTDALKQAVSAWAKANGANIGMSKVEQILKTRAGVAVCLSCKSRGRIQGDLHSLAWNSGSSKLTMPKMGGTRITHDEVLPAGSSVEVDADVGSNVGMKKNKSSNIPAKNNVSNKTAITPPVNDSTPKVERNIPKQRKPLKAIKPMKPISVFEDVSTKTVIDNSKANTITGERVLLPINQ